MTAASMSEKPILFYSRKLEYGWLSNFHRAKQVVAELEFQTNEHYYQSRKTIDHEIAKWIRLAPNPYLAMRVGRNLRPQEMRPDWEKIKVNVMTLGVRAKFTQNPDLKEKLLATGNAFLAEDSPTDNFWGIKGRNMLGKILMQVRDELRNVSRSV